MALPLRAFEHRRKLPGHLWNRYPQRDVETGMSNRIRFMALFSIMAIAVAACGAAQGTDGDSDGGDAETPPVAGMCAPDHPDCEDTVVAPDGDVGEKIEYRPIEPEGNVAGEGTAINDGTLVSRDGNLVTIGFWMGVESCYAVESVDVTETAGEVSVEIIVAARDLDAACIQIAEARSVTVELSQPLGDRALQIGDVVIQG